MAKEHFISQPPAKFVIKVSLVLIRFMEKELYMMRMEK